MRADYWPGHTGSKVELSAGLSAEPPWAFPQPTCILTTASYPRTVLMAARASQLTLVESYGGPEGARYLTNAVTDVVADLPIVEAQVDSFYADADDEPQPFAPGGFAPESSLRGVAAPA